MFVSRVFSRLSRSVCSSSMLVSTSQRSQHLPVLSNHFHSLVHQSPNQMIPVHVNLLQPPRNSSLTAIFRFSSSASPEKEHGNNENNGTSTNADPAKTSEEAKVNGQTKSDRQTEAADQSKESGSISESPSHSESVKRRRGGTKRTAFSDSDSDLEAEDLSRDDLVKLLAEKEELLKLKHKEIEKMQDKVLRTYAEMENVMDRTRREAENSKKFSIQNFAKDLLDVADNLGRASSVVKDSFSKIDASNDSTGAVPLLKTLLEGVEMTEKQLAEVFKKFGVEKFDPTNETFDPHRHNAIFQIPDGSKPPGTVAAVLKAGYVLYERVIRPAEVGVTKAVEDNNATDKALKDKE